MNESELRDIVANSLDRIEPGLELLKKEAYFPNELGTRGFVDILARDRDSKLVLIELKRSDATSREALHEVLKYAEGAKAHLGVKEQDIRVLIVSTDWKELFVPFSRFVSDTELKVEGLQLDINTRGEFRVVPVRPLEIENGQFIAPWHEIRVYESEAGMVRGQADLAASMASKGIEDYVVLVLKAADDFNEYARESLFTSLYQILGDRRDAREKANALPVYEYILYLGIRILSVSQCLKLLSRHPEKLVEAEEVIVDMEGDELLGTLHEYLLDAGENARADYFEIGYPAKLSSKLLETEGWTTQQILRFGTFSRNPVLSDDDILAELCGTTGATGQILKRQVNLRNRAEVAALRRDLDSCLEGNSIWRAHADQILSELVADPSATLIDVHFFNPSAGLMTIYHAASDASGIRFWPSYWINVIAGEGYSRSYFGVLEVSGSPMGLTSLLEKYYDGDLFSLLMTMSWGGYESRDVQVLGDAGARYRSYRTTLPVSDDSFDVLSESVWIAAAPCDPFGAFVTYIEANSDFVAELVASISERMIPGGFVG